MLELLRSGRLRRMCVKELRETLRDRRTLFTLILMPLIVYPLLSMALQRFILLAANNTSTAENYLVGVTNEADIEPIGTAITIGQQANSPKAYRPLRMEDPSNSRDANAPMKPTSNWKVVVEQDLDLQLELGRIDLAIQVIRTTETKSDRDETNRLRANSYRFEVHYRQSEAHSEAAVYEFQRLLQAVNDQQALMLRQQFGSGREAAVELLATSIGRPSSITSSIASVIPLILLLMTITGAVYPAIDLTAGERERGTMEALISTPVPRFALLMSKYVAVVTVSILTALINVTGMFMTLSIGGLGRAILGNEGIPWHALFPIFPLLVLFSCFFSAILLALCCVAKSFKEAQAYLIPVMLLSLGPGILSVLPGVYLTPNMAVVPLFNMILLARDVMAGHFEWLSALIVIISTLLYSVGVMAIAAKLFGRHAIAQHSDVSWKALLFPSSERNKPPKVSELAIFLAMFFPIYFVATNTIGVAEEISLVNRLWTKAGLTFLLFCLLPVAYVGWRGLSFKLAFRPFENTRWIFLLPGLVLLASGLWTIAHEIFVFSEWLGLASLRPEQIATANQTKLALQQLPLAVIWITMAVVPAIAEEMFFRGFALRCFQNLMKPSYAILASAVLFGAFHVVAGSILSVERFLPTAALGWVLGWLAWRTGSLFPGILVHAGHNGLLFTMAHQEDWLRNAGWGMTDERHLPIVWLAAGIAVVISGLAIVQWGSRLNESTTADTKDT